MQTNFLRITLILMFGFSFAQISPAFAEKLKMPLFMPKRAKLLFPMPPKEGFFDEDPSFSKNDPIASPVDEILKKVRKITFSDWQNLRKSADDARKAQHLRESLRLYKEAEILAKHSVEGWEKEANITEEDHRFPLALTENLATLGYFRSAKTRLELLLKNDFYNEKESPSLLVCTLNQLADINLTLGLIKDAKDELDRASKIADENKLVDEHALKTKILQANTLFNESEFAESRTLFSDVLSVSETLGDKGKSLKADSLDGLARISSIQGKQAEAEQNQEQSFAIRNEIFGEASLESSHSMMTLADIKAKKTPVEAKDLRLKALSIQLKALETQNHPTIGRTMLALITSDIKPYSIAENACETARCTVDGIIDEESPFYASYLLNLADALGNQQKVKPGIETCERAISLKTRLYGDRSISVAKALSTLAALQLQDVILKSIALQKFEKIQCPEAERSCRAAMAIADERLGSGNDLSASTLSILARIEQLQGDHSSSAENFKKAIAVMETSYGADSKTVLWEKTLLLQPLTSLHKRKEANDLAAQLLSARIKQNGVFNKEVIEVLGMASESNPKDHVLENLNKKLYQIVPSEDAGSAGNFAKLVSWFGRPGSQADFYKAELNQEESTYGKSSPAIAGRLTSLADEYSRVRNFSDSNPAFRRAISIIETGLGPNHPALIKVLTKYSEMLKDSGNEKEAAIQSARCAAIQAEWKEKN